MSNWVSSHIETLEIECWTSMQIQTTITFYSDAWLTLVTGVQTCALPISSRRGAVAAAAGFALGTEALTYARTFFAETLEFECWSSEPIQTTITFYSDVRLSDLIYRDARNWMLNLWANSNDNNFLVGCLIEFRHISRRSKLNVDPLIQFKRQ